MRLADSYIDAQEGALLAQDAIAEWLDRYRLQLDSQTEQVIYEGTLTPSNVQTLSNSDDRRSTAPATATK